jgi:DNA-binding NtrC family response regulator
VGDLPPSIQAKLLRVLESRQARRVGSLRPYPIDARFLAATNRDLDGDVARGSFRRDLYFRLNGITLVVPPLRERPRDIVPLARAFLRRACARGGISPVPDLTDDACRALERHSWPGNVRELLHAIERAVVLADGRAIGAEQLALQAGATSRSVPEAAETARALDVRVPDVRGDEKESLRHSVRSVERQRILDALERCGGNQTQAAKLLSITRRTLARRLDAFGVTRPRKGNRD